MESGCAQVAAFCRVVQRSAQRSDGIAHITGVFDVRNGLLICGLKVRFLRGSPLNCFSPFSFLNRGILRLHNVSKARRLEQPDRALFCGRAEVHVAQRR